MCALFVPILSQFSLPLISEDQVGDQAPYFDEPLPRSATIAAKSALRSYRDGKNSKYRRLVETRLEEVPKPDAIIIPIGLKPPIPAPSPTAGEPGTIIVPIGLKPPIPAPSPTASEPTLIIPIGPKPPVKAPIKKPE